MGIQSTRHITRERAIERILKVAELVVNYDYKELESISDDSENYIKDFVDNGLSFNIEHIHKWTNKMLIDVMDGAFFRFSMYENYSIEE